MLQRGLHPVQMNSLDRLEWKLCIVTVIQNKYINNNPTNSEEVKVCLVILGDCGCGGHFN